MTLRDAAALVGLSYQAALNAENGVAKLKTAVFISKSLGVPESEVLRRAQAYVTELCAKVRPFAAASAGAAV